MLEHVIILLNSSLEFDQCIKYLKRFVHCKLEMANHLITIRFVNLEIISPSAPKLILFLDSLKQSAEVADMKQMFQAPAINNTLVPRFVLLLSTKTTPIFPKTPYLVDIIFLHPPASADSNVQCVFELIAEFQKPLARCYELVRSSKRFSLAMALLLANPAHRPANQLHQFMA